VLEERLLGGLDSLETRASLQTRRDKVPMSRNSSCHGFPLCIVLGRRILLAGTVRAA
jgi:hypothetical protein